MIITHYYRKMSDIGSSLKYVPPNLKHSHHLWHLHLANIPPHTLVAKVSTNVFQNSKTVFKQICCFSKSFIVQIYLDYHREIDD